MLYFVHAAAALADTPAGPAATTPVVPAAAAPTPTATAGAPAAAATPDTGGGEAPAAATTPDTAGAEAPAAAEPPPLAAIVVVDPFELAAKARHGELSLSRVPAAGDWEVRDGRGQVVDARSWALLIGDPTALAKVETARRRGRTLGWGLVGAGSLIGLAAIVPAVMLEETFGTNESDTEFDEVQIRNDLKVAVSFGMVGAGAVLAGTGLAHNIASDRRAELLARHISAAEADAAIAAYNERMASVLGVKE